MLRHALRGDFGLALSPLVIEQTRRWLASLAPGYLPQIESFLEHCSYVPIEPASPQDVRANAGLVRDVTDLPVVLGAIQACARILVSEDRDLTDQDEGNEELHRRIQVMLSGTFLREVMGWSHEDLEAVRGRRWQDLPLDYLTHWTTSR